MRSLLLFALLFPMPQAAPQTAREYYEEIYKAGGLDPSADAKVCFDDDPKNENFFIFGESKTIRAFMIANGTFAKLPKNEQAELKKDFLIVRGYGNGVAFDAKQFFDPDGSSWVGEPIPVGKEGFVRPRLSINPQTLRYRRAAEILNPDSTFRSQSASFGRCEEVKTDIPQHGN